MPHKSRIRLEDSFYVAFMSVLEHSSLLRKQQTLKIPNPPLLKQNKRLEIEKISVVSRKITDDLEKISDVFKKISDVLHF